LGLVEPARAIAKRGYYPCLKERVSMLDFKRQALVTQFGEIETAVRSDTQAIRFNQGSAVA
jgi:hypothetical protein